jgi:hypothetical protein
MLTSAKVWGNPRKVPCIAVNVVRWQEFAARSRRPAGRAGEGRGGARRSKSKTVSPAVRQASSGATGAGRTGRRVLEMISMQMEWIDYGLSGLETARGALECMGLEAE